MKIADRIDEVIKDVQVGESIVFEKGILLDVFNALDSITYRNQTIQDEIETINEELGSMIGRLDIVYAKIFEETQLELRELKTKIETKTKGRKK